MRKFLKYFFAFVFGVLTAVLVIYWIITANQFWNFTQGDRYKPNSTKNCQMEYPNGTTQDEACANVDGVYYVTRLGGSGLAALVTFLVFMHLVSPKDDLETN